VGLAEGLHRVVRSGSLITSISINLLNLQDHLREANSTAAQNKLKIIDPAEEL
jgi:hypothetical protein